MHEASGDQVHVTAEGRVLLTQLGLTFRDAFDHAGVKVWRKLPDRENCTLDVMAAEGGVRRLHIKRYVPGRGASAAGAEALGIELLKKHGISTVPLVAWGQLGDGRSAVMVEDLTGFKPADDLLRQGAAFETLLEPTAAMAAKLHSSGLHHRDLYLCHFFAKLGRGSSNAAGEAGSSVELRLIDCARVRRLPVFFRQRWIIKDLAQFWYSTQQVSVSDAQRQRWLECYGRSRGLEGLQLRRAIEAKARWIARHDARLSQLHPERYRGNPA